jgi:hypothetical protein
MAQPTPPPTAAVPPLEGWGPVVITSREIYDGLVRVSAQLGVIQQQLAQHTDEHERRDQEIEARFRDHENRIRTQEKARWPIASVTALVGLAAVVVAIVALFYR